MDVEATNMPIDHGNESTMPTEKVRRQRDFYETLLQTQSDLGEGLLVVEGERLRYVNEAFCLMSGYSMAELAALSTFLELAVPEQRPMLEDRMRRRLRGEVVEDRYETALLHKSGRRVDLEVAVRLLRRENRLPQLIFVVRDISEHKRAEERLRRSLEVLVALHEAGNILGSTLEPEEIGTKLLEIVRRVSNPSAAVINLVDEHGRLLVLRSSGPESLWRSVNNTPEAQAARRAALETKEHQLVRAIRLKGCGPLVGLWLPLRVRNRVIGLLEACGSEVLAEKAAVETLESLTIQAASALENARLYGELAERERRLQDLVGKLLVAQEEERRRVAYEVHDGVTQQAVAAHLNLQAYAKDQPPNSPSNQRKLDRALQLLKQTIREARHVVANLQPAALDEVGLATALRLQVESFRAEGWEIGYDEALGERRLPAEIETTLYRVIQEALTNVRKHALTTHVHITLARRGQKVYLEVRDQGRGFNRSTLPERNGRGERVGLCSMRERIALLGGEFRIRSQPGAGTSVVAEIPLPRSWGNG